MKLPNELADRIIHIYRSLQEKVIVIRKQNISNHLDSMTLTRFPQAVFHDVESLSGAKMRERKVGPSRNEIDGIGDTHVWWTMNVLVLVKHNRINPVIPNSLWNDKPWFVLFDRLKSVIPILSIRYF